MNTFKRHFKVGSRKSQLAMIQTHWVIGRLHEINPEATFEIVEMNTLGDKILDVALSKIGDKGLFTKELETALLSREIDFVVHSLKDLPTNLPEGLTIAGITKREDPRDVVLFKNNLDVRELKDLPPGSTVGTSSVRRIAQLKKHYPHLNFMDVRGNLNTRLTKLNSPDGPYSALILAAAGVLRLGWEKQIGQYLEWEDCMHAVGQGALGVECDEENEDALKILEPLNDADTYFRCVAERSFLRLLEGGCSVPVAVFSEVKHEKGHHFLTLRGSVWNLDGSKSVDHHLTKNLEDFVVDEKLKDIILDLQCTSVCTRRFPGYGEESHQVAVQLGVELGNVLLSLGAREILEEVKSQGKT